MSFLSCSKDFQNKWTNKLVTTLLQSLLNMPSQLNNDFKCIKHYWNSIVNSVRLHDWTAKLEIIASKVRYQILNQWEILVISIITRMHSSRMRTGRTLTIFRKLENHPPPKIWSRHPPENLEQAPPPENLEQAPPPKIWRRPPPWTESHTRVKILPWPKLRFGR